MFQCSYIDPYLSKHDTNVAGWFTREKTFANVLASIPLAMVFLRPKCENLAFSEVVFAFFEYFCKFERILA